MRRRRTSITFVSGMRGSGKTYWTRRFALDQGRVMIFDPMSEYGSATQHHISELGAFLDYMETASSSSLLDVAFDPLDHATAIRYFCRCALVVRNVTVIIDELDIFCRPNLVPLELEKLIKYGRHCGVSIVGVSRRPSEVARLFTSQANRFVVFRQIEPRDIVHWRSILGDLAHEIPTLPDYHYIDWDFNRPAARAGGIKKPLQVIRQRG